MSSMLEPFSSESYYLATFLRSVLFPSRIAFESFKLEFRDRHLGRLHANGHDLSVGLVSYHAFDVDLELLPGHLYVLTLPLMVVNTHDHTVVIMAHRDGIYVVLSAQLLFSRSTS